MPTVYTIGEATYDIIFKNQKPIEAKVGGSLLNTSVSLGRLGVPISFISTFGNDLVGNQVMSFLLQNNIDASFVNRFDGNSRIALAFLDEQNNAQYFFYKNTGKALLNFPQIHQGDIVLFGSSHALREDIHNELIQFIKAASLQGAIIIYDPNFRKSQLSQLNTLKPLIEENISLANIVKGSDEDFSGIFNAKFSSEAYSIIRKISKAVLIYTANKDGVYLHTDKYSTFYDVPSIKPISTIGAGDTFNAGIIFSIYKLNPTSISLNETNLDLWDRLIETSIVFAQEVCLSYENYLTPQFIGNHKLKLQTQSEK